MFHIVTLLCFLVLCFAAVFFGSIKMIKCENDIFSHFLPQSVYLFLCLSFSPFINFSCLQVAFCLSMFLLIKMNIYTMFSVLKASD